MWSSNASYTSRKKDEARLLRWRYTLSRTYNYTSRSPPSLTVLSNAVASDTSMGKPRFSASNSSEKGVGSRASSVAVGDLEGLKVSRIVSRTARHAHSPHSPLSWSMSVSSDTTPDSTISRALL